MVFCECSCLCYMSYYRKKYFIPTVVCILSMLIFNAQAADEPNDLIILPIKAAAKSITNNTPTNSNNTGVLRPVSIDKINPNNANAATDKISKSASANANNANINNVLKTNSAQNIIDIDRDSIQNQYFKNNESLWARIRGGFSIATLDANLVEESTSWYASRPEYFSRINERASKYLYYIVEELEKRNMPLELALLPIIESAFNPVAKSSAKAAGIWQFMPKTGRYFNLQQNLFVDERRDVLSSTSAALDYLQKLYTMFGDWHLALAAYNWGEGSVSRAIARNRAQGLPVDYLSLNMPHETRQYVPKLLAVKNIIANPEKYNIQLMEIANHPYFITLTTSKDIDVELAAEFAGMTSTEFKSINPSFNKPIIIGATNPQILLPWDKAQKFQDSLKNYTGQLASLTAIKLSQKEKVETLANRYNVEASDIRRINHIGKGFRFKAGSIVLMPKVSGGRLDADITENIAENGHIRTEKDTPTYKKVFVYVQKNDSLSDVAHRYDVSVTQLHSWNDIGRKIKQGMRLAITVPYAKVIDSHYVKPEPEIVITKKQARAMHLAAKHKAKLEDVSHEDVSNSKPRIGSRHGDKKNQQPHHQAFTAKHLVKDIQIKKQNNDVIVAKKNKFVNSNVSTLSAVKSIKMVKINHKYR
jgi:membrane-bound lytic murein transglycosylase D